MPGLGEVTGVGALLVSIIVAAMHGRNALKAQRLQNEMSGATIALNFAQRVEQRLNALEDFHTEAGEWWDEHTEWDRIRDRELARLDPSFTVAEPKPFPRLRRQDQDTQPPERKDR